LRLATGPHALDPLAANPRIHPIRDRLDLWQLRHRSLEYSLPEIGAP
jgi:hypothetical protein